VAIPPTANAPVNATIAQRIFFMICIFSRLKLEPPEPAAIYTITRAKSRAVLLFFDPTGIRALNLTN